MYKNLPGKTKEERHKNRTDTKSSEQAAKACHSDNDIRAILLIGTLHLRCGPILSPTKTGTGDMQVRVVKF